MRISQMVNLSSARYQNIAAAQMKKSSDRVSSGYRINSAADDAAGLAISERMRSQIRGLNVASNNIQNGISMIQVADGALSGVTDTLQDVREKLVEAASSTDANAIASIRSYVDSALKGINDVLSNTKFNGKSLFSTTEDVDFKIQLGANAGESTTVTFGKIDTSTLFGDANTTIIGDTEDDFTSDSASTAIADIDKALKNILEVRASAGATSKRLEHSLNVNGITSENLTDAESRIRDVDVAKESLNFTKNNILQQSAQAMMAQANQNAYGILDLLR